MRARFSPTADALPCLLAVSQPTRISRERLQRIRWQHEAAYRSLAYYFTVRWNRARLGAYVDRVLGAFAVPPDPEEIRNPPTPGIPPRYSLVDLGRGEQNRYRILYANEEVMVSDDPGDILHHLFWHVNSETFRTTGNFLLVHAGSVVTPAGGGVLLPAASGAGKSTLVAALVEAGFGYLSDEAGAIDPIGGRLYPYPKALSFKKARRQLLPHLARRNGTRLMKTQWHLRPEDIRPASIGGPCEVRYIIALRYEDGASAKLTPLNAAAAAVELAAHALNLPLFRGRVLPLLEKLALGARSYRLVYGDLGEGVRVISEITSGPSVQQTPRDR